MKEKLTVRKCVRRMGSTGPFNGIVLQTVPENNSVRVAWWDDATSSYYDADGGEWLSMDEVEPIMYGKNVQLDGTL